MFLRFDIVFMFHLESFYEIFYLETITDGFIVTEQRKRFLSFLSSEHFENSSIGSQGFVALTGISLTFGYE